MKPENDRTARLKKFCSEIVELVILIIVITLVRCYG